LFTEGRRLLLVIAEDQSFFIFKSQILVYRQCGKVRE
jgi:hypothetical protein